MGPYFSVIIPLYNAEKYIGDCLLSVRKQTFSDIEIIVTDDCSTDRGPEIVKAQAKEDPRIVLITLPDRQGAAVARNTGVQLAKGKYVAFLDSDDLWLPEKLEKQYAVLRHSKGNELCCTAAACMDANGRLNERTFRVPSRITFDNLLRGNDIVCSSLVLPRELALRYPMKRGDFHEDYVCWLNIIKSGNMVVGVHEPLTLYRFTPGSLSRNKFKSAVKTWRSYKKVGIPFLYRLQGFFGYIVHGIKRYF